jgi:hypothetical protein
MSSLDLTLDCQPVADFTEARIRLTFSGLNMIAALPYITRLGKYCKELWKDKDVKSKCVRSQTNSCEIEVWFKCHGDLFDSLPPVNEIIRFCKDMVQEIESTRSKKGATSRIGAYSTLLHRYSFSIEQGAFMRELDCPMDEAYAKFKEKWPRSIKTKEDVEGFYSGILLRRGQHVHRENGGWKESGEPAKDPPAQDAQGAPPEPTGDSQVQEQVPAPAPAKEGQDTAEVRIKRGDKVRVRIDADVTFNNQIGSKPPRVGSNYKGEVKNVRGDGILVKLPMGDVWVRTDAVEKVDD